MNRREAKIKALWLISGILAGVDAIYLELPYKDQRWVEEEFDKIADRITERAIRLERNKP